MTQYGPVIRSLSSVSNAFNTSPARVPTENHVSRAASVGRRLRAPAGTIFENVRVRRVSSLSGFNFDFFFNLILLKHACLFFDIAFRPAQPYILLHATGRAFALDRRKGVCARNGTVTTQIEEKVLGGKKRFCWTYHVRVTHTRIRTPTRQQRWNDEMCAGFFAISISIPSYFFSPRPSGRDIRWPPCCLLPPNRVDCSVPGQPHTRARVQYTSYHPCIHFPDQKIVDNFTLFLIFFLWVVFIV